MDAVVKFYEMVTHSVLLYISEIWILMTQHLKWIETLGGYALYNYQYNEDMRQIISIRYVIKNHRR
jgi:hypothetical protein